MKYRIFGKKQVFWLIMALIWLTVIVTVVVLTATKRVNAGARRVPVYCVDRADKTISLTFNAAWGDETTDEILNILRENGVKATFFFVGTFAESYPESVKKIANEGHEIANHSMRHRDPTEQDEKALRKDISDCSDLLYSLTGIKPALYRAPAGVYNNEAIEAAGELGLTAVQWSADSIDWKDPTPERIRERIMNKTKPGAILLFHLGKENTAQALPGIIEALKNEGYTFVTVSGLLPEGERYVDAQGVMHAV